MTPLKFAVGIDVDKKTFKACYCLLNEALEITTERQKAFKNDLQGYHELIQWTGVHHREDTPIYFVMEATGVYHEHLAWYLFSKHQKVSIILPSKSKRYLQSLGLKSKNDKLDAKGLAYMGLQQHLPLWMPVSCKIYQLKKLTRYREDLQKQKTTLNNQLEALEHGMYTVKAVTRSIKALIKVIDKQLMKVYGEIEQLINEDSVMKEKIKHLTSIKGVGFLTAVTIVAETNGFALFKNQRQLASYCGYDVTENSSGNRVGKTRISKKGNPHIRRMLHMPSLNVVRFNVPVFRSLYDRVYSKRKIKMVAYTAVQRKLLLLMYTLWKKNEGFNEGILGNSSGDSLSEALKRQDSRKTILHKMNHISLKQPYDPLSEISI